MFRPLKSALARLSNLRCTISPPVRALGGRPEANRFRPRVEGLEDRTVPTPVVTAAALSDAHEGGSGSFRLTRTETTGTLFVSLGFSGTATSGSDYSNPMGATFQSGQATVDVNVGAFDDGTSEPTETVVLTINSGSGYTVGSPSSATISILDNDPPVVSVAKVSDAAEGGADGKFRFTRVGDLSSSLSVSYSVGGTATSGTDYTALGGSVAFAAGAATADVTVSAIDDVDYDPAETVTATVTSGTGYSVGSPSSATVTITDDELGPVYWIGGVGASWSVGTNWTSGAVPTSTTAVYFDAPHSNAGVTTPGNVSLAEMHFINGYSGTVTLAGTLTTGKLELASANATLDQPSSGTDITVNTAMLWTGGTLNSTANVASMTLSGGWGIFAPAGGGTVVSGSSINLSSGATATMKAGNLALANEALFNINNASTLVVDPGTLNVATIKVQIVGVPQININTGGVLHLKSGQLGQVSAGVPLKNAGGSFILEPNTVAVFAGNVDKVANGPSFLQTAGATYLGDNAVIAVWDGAKVSGGLLSIKSGPNGAGFEGDLNVEGGDIRFESMASGDTHEFAQFLVSGDVTWTGGTFHPYVDADTNDGNADVWVATGTFSVGVNAAVDVTAVDGENNIVTPGSNMEWQVLESDTSITTPGADPSLTSGWTFDKQANNPKLWWKVKKA